MFRGAITALVTPFLNGAVDYDAIRSLVEWQIDAGIDGLLACGCTGEAAVLSDEEQMKVIVTVVDATEGRVPVLAGSGTNATKSSIELSKKVVDLGVDGILLITPYYNKPTPAGQIAHYTAVADSVNCPVVLYNVPGRTGTNMLPETIAELAVHPGIVAVKDAAGLPLRVTEIRNLCNITILSGDDSLTMAQVALGAEGVVSVISNIAPAEMSSLVQLTKEGLLQDAREVHDRLYPVMNAMFLETNPAPVKKALAMMGIIENELRLPLVPLSEKFIPELKAELEKGGIL